MKSLTQSCKLGINFFCENIPKESTIFIWILFYPLTACKQFFSCIVLTATSFSGFPRYILYYYNIKISVDAALCLLLFIVLLHFYCFIRMKCYYMIKKMCMSKVRSSRPEVFLRKVVLKVCSKFTGKYSCRSVISIKLI